MKKVSIIVPCYNNERDVGKAIGSLLCQTYGNIEIIVVDDGSTDRSLEAARSAAGSDVRVKVIPSVYLGVSKTRNIGIRNATGDYIMFLDADDRYENDAVEKLLDEAERTGADIVSGGIVRTKDDKILSHNEPRIKGEFSGEGKEKILEEASIGADSALCSFIDKIYRASFLREHGIVFPDLVSGEDSVFAYDAMIASEKIVFLKSHGFYYYEQNPESFTKKKLPLEMRISYSDDFFKGMQQVALKYRREDLLPFLNIRKALAVYDFVMNVVSLEDVSEKEKKKMIEYISSCSFYTSSVNDEALGHHKPNVRLLVKQVIAGKVEKAYRTAVLINTVKKLSGRSV